MVSEIDPLPGDIAVRPEDGVMFGLGFGAGPAHDYSLYQINLTTGAVTDIGPSIGRPGGLAFTANAMLPCDFDGDDKCHLSDIDRMVNDIETGINDPALDLTDDGVVDPNDIEAWLAQAGRENGFPGGKRCQVPFIYSPCSGRDNTRRSARSIVHRLKRGPPLGHAKTRRSWGELGFSARIPVARGRAGGPTHRLTQLAR